MAYVGQQAAVFGQLAQLHGNDVPGSMVDQGRYDRSKDRETRWNESWKRQPVDLNDIVSRFTPGAQGRRRGVKYVFENARWRIDADMVAGYLRIYDKRTKKNVKLNGLPGSNKETHLKFSREGKCDHGTCPCSQP